jgi:uncharacterized OB-fold protein
MSTTPTPPIAASISEPYWQALEDGRLTYQHCPCGHRWLPPRHECPSCLGTDWTWQTASGKARLISWVVYFTAYDESLKDRLPYNVAIVELQEGVRMITNILDCPDGAGLQLDMPVELSISRSHQGILATFVRSTLP